MVKTSTEYLQFKFLMSAVLLSVLSALSGENVQAKWHLFLKRELFNHL